MTRMAEYCRARHILAQADNGNYSNDVLSGAEYCSGRHGQSNPTYFAVQMWLECRFQGNVAANSSVIVSHKDQEILKPRTRSEILEVPSHQGFRVVAEMFAKRQGHGASGRFPDHTKELPVVRKKGPDTWEVYVQVVAPLTDPLGLIIVVRWDVYWRPCCNENLLYNHLRIDEYKDTDGHQLDLQQWYGEVTSKLALLETFLPNQDLAQDSSGNLHGVETGLSSQHPTAADAAVQPTIPSQPGAKRARSFTGTESVDPVERFCTLPPEEQLENIVQNLSSKSDCHGIAIARLRCELQDHAYDLVHVLSELARLRKHLNHRADAHSLSTLSRTISWVESQGRSPSQSQQTNKRPLPSKEQLNLPGSPASLSDRFDSLSVETSSFQRARDRAAPATSTVNFASLGPCPSFDADLTYDQLKPFVFEALRSAQVQSQSPLDLSKILWPQAGRHVRHSMKTLVNGALYRLQDDGKVTKNSQHGVDWSLAPLSL